MKSHQARAVTDIIKNGAGSSCVVSTYQYDGLDQLTRLTHAKASNTLADFQYQFNAVSNITEMIDSAGTHNYTYDTLDRLTAATHPNQPNESYTYDDVGNRTASHQGSSYSYQAFNRLIAANGTSFGYDTNGNQISKTDASGSWTYSWDFENRLKQATLSGGVSVTYSYDALGRRVQRSSSVSGTEKYVYDGADVVRDLDGTNATVADYLNGPGIDNKLREATGASASYFLPDHLGTTRTLADASGTVTSSLSYDSFGNVTSGSALTRYNYTGREIDSDMDLMYYRARWYAPNQGRFHSEDPIRFSGGDVNLYSYVGSNPLITGDPLGLCPQNRTPTLPCDVLPPTNPNDRAVAETLMGEATREGSPQYGDEQGGSRAVGHPLSGVVPRGAIRLEEYLMVSVIENRAIATGQSWFDVVNAKQANGNFQFEGYPNGKNYINQLGNKGSDMCERLRGALDAINAVKLNGPNNRFGTLMNWRGVLQLDNNGVPFVRHRKGALRIAGTDFF